MLLFSFGGCKYWGDKFRTGWKVFGAGAGTICLDAGSSFGGYRCWGGEVGAGAKIFGVEFGIGSGFNRW